MTQHVLPLVGASVARIVLLGRLQVVGRKKQKEQSVQGVSPAQFYCGRRRAYNLVFEKCRMKSQRGLRNRLPEVKIQERDDPRCKYWQSWDLHLVETEPDI